MSLHIKINGMLPIVKKKKKKKKRDIYYMVEMSGALKPAEPH